MKCLICDAPMPGQRTEYPQYPFCSKRCKLIDLGRWLSEDYKITNPTDEDRSSPAEPGQA